MNRLTSNPNVRRFGLPLAVVAAVLGGVACTPRNPAPTPSETTASTASRPTPSCALSAKVDGKTATINLGAKNEFEPGVYGVEKVTYEYGDGQSSTDAQANTVASHTYAKAGSYTIKASMVMEVAPGAAVDAPFPDGFAVPCTPTAATIG